jgi:hypothetical protein
MPSARRTGAHGWLRLHRPGRPCPAVDHGPSAQGADAAGWRSWSARCWPSRARCDMATRFAAHHVQAAVTAVAAGHHGGAIGRPHEGARAGELEQFAAARRPGAAPWHHRRAARTRASSSEVRTLRAAAAAPGGRPAGGAGASWPVPAVRRGAASCGGSHAPGWRGCPDSGRRNGAWVPAGHRAARRSAGPWRATLGAWHDPMRAPVHHHPLVRRRSAARLQAPSYEPLLFLRSPSSAAATWPPR